ncbi:hypothetical protein EJB05_15647, partial [Eragrostis curvula]
MRVGLDCSETEMLAMGIDGVPALVAFTSMMAPLKIVGGCTQFAKLSSTTNAGSHMTLRAQPQLLDPKECKRQRERNRIPQAGDVAGHKGTIDFNEKLSDTPTSPAKTSSWIISSDEKKEAKRRRERARYANMTHEKKKYRFHR